MDVTDRQSVRHFWWTMIWSTELSSALLQRSCNTKGTHIFIPFILEYFVFERMLRQVVRILKDDANGNIFEEQFTELFPAHIQVCSFARSNTQSWKFLKESVKNCTLVLKILKGTQLSSTEAVYWRDGGREKNGRKYLNSIENVSCFLGKIGILFDYS